MKILFDTSVLIAASVETHPMHDRAFPWLRKAKAREFTYLVSAHSLAEMYVVLTRLPVVPRISPTLGLQLVRENVMKEAKVVPLSAADYTAVLTDMEARNQTGGAIYDALIVQSAKKMAADRLLTFNPQDFLRVWPEGKQAIRSP